MRILRVSQHLYPDVTGGMPYHVHAMSRDQADMGHDVTVVTVSADESLPRSETRDGYEIVRARPNFEVVGNAFAKEVWDELLAADEYDVVHAHAHYYFSTLFAAIRRRFSDTPLAITNHGMYSQTAPEHVFRWYLKTLGRWTFNRADLVYCYTDKDRQRVRGLGVTSRIEVVPNGIDTERFSPDGPESELIDASGPVVLFVGRFTEGKRPRLAVEAFAEVHEEYPDAVLYLCGDGPLREELEAQVRELGLSDAVTFLGHVPYDEMPNVYRSGDVLVLPSRAEGVPRTVMEVMASGVRAVTSDLPQVRSVFGSYDRFICVDSLNDMGGAIVLALNDGKDEEIQSVHGMKWNKTVNRTTEHLQSLTP